MDMNIEDWDVTEDIEIEENKKEFKLEHLKIENYYWNSGEINLGMPISTSIELTSNYNFETNKLDWTKTISHTYISLEDEKKYETNTHEEKIENPEEIIKKLEENDLRDLKNNYFTDETPEKFTHWELTYNYYFKIVGTYDKEIEEFTNIKDILDFKKIMEEETKKVKNI